METNETDILITRAWQSGDASDLPDAFCLTVDAAFVRHLEQLGSAMASCGASGITSDQMRATCVAEDSGRIEEKLNASDNDWIQMPVNAELRTVPTICMKAHMHSPEAFVLKAFDAYDGTTFESAMMSVRDIRELVQPPRAQDVEADTGAYDPQAPGAPIRHLPAPAHGGRVETGPTAFGDDWPGVFIRGDAAFGLAGYLEVALQEAEAQVEQDGVSVMSAGHILAEAGLQQVLQILRSCDIHAATEVGQAAGPQMSDAYGPYLRACRVLACTKR